MSSYLAHGPEIYSKAHENPRAFSCIFGPIFLESSIQCPWGVGLHQDVHALLPWEGRQVGLGLGRRKDDQNSSGLGRPKSRWILSTHTSPIAKLTPHANIYENTVKSLLQRLFKMSWNTRLKPYITRVPLTCRVGYPTNLKWLKYKTQKKKILF